MTRWLNRVWFLSHYAIKPSGLPACRVHTTDTLAEVQRLQNKYPSDYVALPQHVFWYEVADVKTLNKDRLCANVLFSLPFRALEIVENKLCKGLLVNDALVEFHENGEVTSRECKKNIRDLLTLL